MSADDPGPRPALGSHAVEWRDETWFDDGTISHLARIYEPVGDEAPASGRVAIVDVHGGAWCDNDRKAGTVYNKLLASHGLVAVAIDFRTGPEHRHPAASDDVAAAVEWVRSRADRLGIDPERVVLVGSSSGGHLSLLASLDLEPSVCGVVALWPPTDPLVRYQYATSLGNEHGARLMANTEAYFGTEEAMADGGVANRVEAGRFRQLVPVLLVHPELDKNVPRPITERLADVWPAAGGELEVLWVPDQAHAFGNFEGEATDEMVVAILDWLGDTVPDPR